MKATGEVMAIDRTFGSALNKALRGLEQAGVGPLAEDPAWHGTLAYLEAVAADPDEDAGPLIDEWGTRASRRASRSAAPRRFRRRFLEPSDLRLWRVLALLRRDVPGGDRPGSDRHCVVVPRRDGPQRPARGGRPCDRVHASSTPATAMRRSCSLRSSAHSSATGRPRALAAVGSTRSRRARAALPASAWATRWSTPVPPSSRPRRRTSTGRSLAAGSPAEAPPVARPAALVIGSGPVRDRADRVRPAPCAADTLRSAGWQAVMVNSTEQTSADFDASSGSAESLDAESVRNVIEAETVAGEPGPSGRRRVRRPDAAPRGVARGGRRASAGERSGSHRPGRGADTVRGAARPARHPAARGRDGPLVEEALTLADRIGYPVIVRPSFVIGGLAIDFCHSPDDLVRQLAAATVVDPTGPSGSTATWKAWRSTSTPCPTGTPS